MPKDRPGFKRVIEPQYMIFVMKNIKTVGGTTERVPCLHHRASKADDIQTMCEDLKRDGKKVLVMEALV